MKEKDVVDRIDALDNFGQEIDVLKSKFDKLNERMKTSRIPIDSINQYTERIKALTTFIDSLFLHMK